MGEKEGDGGLVVLLTKTGVSPALPFLEHSRPPSAQLAPTPGFAYLDGPAGGTCHWDHFADGKDEAGKDHPGSKQQRWGLNSD